MKKCLSIASALTVAFATLSSAQVGIEWNSTRYFYQSNGTDQLTNTAVHLLLWSATDPAANALSVQPGTGTATGEFILHSNSDSLRSGDVREEWGRFTYATTPLVFSDADVGNADINNGYVFSRIFEYDTISAGNWFFQSPNFLSPVITTYNPMDTGTIMPHLTADFSYASVQTMGQGSDMFTVIPEPGTMAFLVLGVLTLGARRYLRTRRDD
jgi:hypothetical protein